MTLRIFKRLTTAPSPEWSNRYDLSVVGTPTTQDLEDSCFDILDLERSLHLGSVGFNRMVLSTYQADSSPYDPTALLTMALSVSGLKAASGDPLDLRVALFVRRQVDVGRIGKLLYRGSLSEGEVSAPAGIVALSNEANTSLNGVINTWEAGSGLEFMSATGPLLMVMLNNGGSTARIVRSLSVGGATITKQNHRYYDVV
jgi:hypothetical protein